MEFWAAMTALATVALWVTAVVTARFALKALELSRTDGIHRMRPLVHAQLEQSARGASALDLLITNTGQTSAVDVTITLPELEATAGEVILTQVFVRHPFTLAPGQSQRFPWSSGVADEIDFRGKRLISVSYEGALHPGSRYQENHPLDGEMYFLYDYKALEPREVPSA